MRAKCGCCDRPLGGGADLGCPDCIDLVELASSRSIMAPSCEWEDAELEDHDG